MRICLALFVALAACDASPAPDARLTSSATATPAIMGAEVAPTAAHRATTAATAPTTAAPTTAAAPAAATGAPGNPGKLPTIAASALPVEGQAVLRRIASGGPFEYEKDGSTFGNYEKLLPQQSRGYYREYTVKTPGVSHRGPRRIVCGGSAHATSDCYFTLDHYASFRFIEGSLAPEALTAEKLSP